MTGLPLVNYSGNFLQFKRGPQNFTCMPVARVNDNLSTAGWRERVVQAIDLIITFDMQAIRVADDYQAWATFQTFALAGNQFAFAPSVNGGYFDCVSDDTTIEPMRKGAAVYAAKCKWRIVPDQLQPTDYGVVMGMFYQILSPLSITTATTLPSGTHGSGYSQTLAASGGSGYVWTLATNAIAPGLSLSSGGTISGTPTTAGTYQFTACVTAGGYSAYATFTVVIS